VRSERVRSHLDKNLGSPAAELLRRERAHAKRTHKAEAGPPTSELRLLLPGNFLAAVLPVLTGKAKSHASEQKLLRILSKQSAC